MRCTGALALLCGLAVAFGPAGTAAAKQPVVIHRKLPRSALRARHPHPRRAFLQEASRTAPTTAPTATAAPSMEQRQLSEVALVNNEVDLVRHSSEEEHDMIETQLLSNSESLHIIKHLAESLAAMRHTSTVLEGHVRACQRRYQDLVGSTSAEAEGNALA